ncbi:MAG: FAD:protein FMN transferase [Candidatus Binatia bacterium]|nr:FAD:protein FMN transferase [Candidatus Binatia bacterium]
MIRHALCTLTFLLFVLGPSQGAAHPAVAIEGQVVMGTVIEVTVAAASPQDAQAIAREAVTIARYWDEVLSPFLPYSELSRLHQHATHPIYPSEALRWALRRAVDLSLATRGAFDPAYRSTFSATHPSEPAMPRILEVIEWREAGVRLSPGGSIDPGAFGKGIALDAIASWARARGAQEIFVNFGGSSFLREAEPRFRGQPRRVLLPDATSQPLGIAELDSGSLSVSTSGQHDDATPIVDPTTGKAVGPRRMAAAWATDATSADAWSTALIVLGSSGIPLAQEQGVEALVWDEGGVATTKHFPWRRASPHDATNLSRLEAGNQ